MSTVGDYMQFGFNTTSFRQIKDMEKIKKKVGEAK